MCCLVRFIMINFVFTEVTSAPVHDDTSGEDTSDEEDDDRNDGASGDATDDVRIIFILYHLLNFLSCEKVCKQNLKYKKKTNILLERYNKKKLLISY